MKKKQQLSSQSNKQTVESYTLNIVIVGHVDHGKSTLIGKLLFDNGTFAKERIEAIKDLCQKQNRPFEYAYFLDALEEEQAQNVTIDTTRIYFKTQQRKVCIIDAPGHREFLKNMVTGAASANAAVLIVDVNEGVQAQTKAHANILVHLGIKHVLVAVNKMDQVNYNQHHFQQVKEKITAYLQTLGLSALATIPISAREGELITAPSEKMPWYKGLPILQWLDKIPLDNLTKAKRLRIPIQTIFNLKGERLYLGQVTAGNLKIGDSLRIEPHGNTTKVSKLFRANLSVNEVVAGDSAGIGLADQVFVERGNVLVLEDEKQFAQKTIQASVFWFGKQPLKLSQRIVLMLATARVNAHVSAIKNKISSTVLTKITKDSDELKQGDTAELTLNLHAPLFVDHHQDYPQTGRFVIETNGSITGGGTIKEIKESTVVRQSTSTSKPTPIQAKAKESKKRSLLKALSWRFIATISTAGIAWLITRNFDFAVAIGILDIVWKLFLYYFHERFWERVPYGRAKQIKNAHKSGIIKSDDVVSYNNETLTPNKPI